MDLKFAETRKVTKKASLTFFGVLLLTTLAISSINTSALEVKAQTTDDINYDITIDAYCLTENSSISVEVRMDGGVWQLTPYTFANLNDSHIIEVGSFDPNGHPFVYWDDDSNLTSTNRTISSGGNYTAIYQDTIPELEFEIDIDPDTLNLKSRGKFVTVYIELPEGYNTTDLELVYAWLEGIPAINDTKYGFVTNPELMDHDDDGLMEFMVKFERTAVQKVIKEMIGDENGKFEEIELKVTGEFSDGTVFEDSDSVKVINPPSKSSDKSNDSTRNDKQRLEDKRNK
ncbi:hypothetical protein [[Eubacterium] cellulosolvens]